MQVFITKGLAFSTLQKAKEYIATHAAKKYYSVGFTSGLAGDILATYIDQHGNDVFGVDDDYGEIIKTYTVI